MTQNINMVELVSADTINTMIVGVLLQYPKGYRDSALDGIRDYPIIINMPCSHVLIFDEKEKFPTSNVPCSCENQNHWFVKLEETDNDN